MDSPSSSGMDDLGPFQYAKIWLEEVTGFEKDTLTHPDGICYLLAYHYHHTKEALAVFPVRICVFYSMRRRSVRYIRDDNPA